ncbi:MAG: hypothetical protein E7313_05745 [Clostridiales bacterium]|nr:hypothetical protein [Clostridiales bacterium]
MNDIWKIAEWIKANNPNNFKLATLNDKPLLLTYTNPRNIDLPEGWYFVKIGTDCGYTNDPIPQCFMYKSSTLKNYYYIETTSTRGYTLTPPRILILVNELI